jgi:hypothetical protein
MHLTIQRVQPPIVHVFGDVDHPDFRDACALIRSQSQFANDGAAAELIVIAQSRPSAIGEQVIQRLRRVAPLAGIVGLLGSWCEGETRTGRPWPGVPRLYWYEFPTWWMRQLALRADGRCPDWARPWDCGFRNSDCGFRNSEIQHFASSPPLTPDTGHHPPDGHLTPFSLRGLIVLRTHHRDTADALSDVFRRAGFATVWQRPGLGAGIVRGATAGIWDGGQLDEREAEDLAFFCRTLLSDAAPVIALLDFPRRDRADRALELGASTVLGKPWRNEALIAQLHTLLEITNAASAA